MAARSWSLHNWGQRGAMHPGQILGQGRCTPPPDARGTELRRVSRRCLGGVKIARRRIFQEGQLPGPAPCGDYFFPFKLMLTGPGMKASSQKISLHAKAETFESVALPPLKSPFGLVAVAL